MFLFNCKGLLFRLLYKDWYGFGNNFLQMDFKIWISVLALTVESVYKKNIVYIECLAYSKMVENLFNIRI